MINDIVFPTKYRFDAVPPERILEVVNRTIRTFREPRPFGGPGRSVHPAGPYDRGENDDGITVPAFRPP